MSKLGGSAIGTPGWHSIAPRTWAPHRGESAALARHARVRRAAVEIGMLEGISAALLRSVMSTRARSPEPKVLAMCEGPSVLHGYPMFVG
jgi:hypothetical protein